jgi:hypothetical protein
MERIHAMSTPQSPRPTARSSSTALLSISLLLLALAAAPAHAARIPSRNRFQQFFPFYADYFQSLLPACSARLESYYEDLERTDPACYYTSPCACAMDCLLDATSESTKVNMQSATIVLGLIPTLFAALAPSIAEMAVLSTWAPALAGVVALGVPTVRLSTTGVDIPGVLLPRAASSSRVLQHLQTWLAGGKRRRLVLGVLLRVAAVAAVANTVETSVRVDLRTASSWRCNQLFMPLIWSELGIVTFGIGMLAIRLRTPGKAALGTTQSTTNVAPKLSLQKKPPLWQKITQQEECTASELLWTLAVVAASVQAFFGTLVMASLIFISLQDAMYVALRYAASCVVCRLVVAVELAGMRIEMKNRSGK